MSGESPEAVALQLLENIARAENMVYSQNPQGVGAQSANRQWVLDTYAECLDAVKSPSARLSTE